MTYIVNPDMPWHYHIEDMHAKFGVNEWIDKQLEEPDYSKLKEYLKFRIDFLQEELNETKEAYEDGDAKEIVDGLIDLCVIAIGTLDAFGCDTAGAWAEVMEANMAKKPGVKATRPNPLGLPDLIKPEGWVEPDHTNTTGFIPSLFPRKES